MAEAPSAPVFCGYPVEKAAADCALKMTAHGLHAERSPGRPQAADTSRHHFDEKGANEVHYECDEGLQLEHRSMVALSGSSVKAGKLGCDQGGSAKFSRLCRSLFWV